MLKWILRYAFRSDEYVYKDLLFEVTGATVGAQGSKSMREMKGLVLYLKLFRPEVGDELYKFFKRLQSWEKKL